ncbi:hypothetical protein [Pseudophaeobacter flagellatus]|uniref:hypothetical protein n=1 Tax=Pseudophaeobacter flagellatus TaxID=2899119 RepID=UPI001E2B1E37|nr:hypothetical protein [Pseudophaeobacter flagellatus]MCD9150010.1 hypothetical protein [Pseudophaeobacter flagellatus]
MEKERSTDELVDTYWQLHRSGQREMHSKAFRGLLFMAPFLILMSAAIFALAGIEIIDPWYWFMCLFPALLFGWWFGVRPLERTKKENRMAQSEIANVLKERIEE